MRKLQGRGGNVSQCGQCPVAGDANASVVAPKAGQGATARPGGYGPLIDYCPVCPLGRY